MFMPKTEAGRCTMRGRELDGITVWTKAVDPEERERLRQMRQRAADAPGSFSPRRRRSRTEKSDPTPIRDEVQP